jgi:signal transduction histidine kinase
MLRDLTGFALILAVLLGSAIALPPASHASSLSLALAQSRETGVLPRQTLKNSRSDDFAERFNPLLQLITANRDLIVYGAIASFGILMMGLAIGSASSGSKNNTTEQLTRLKEEKEKAENLAKLKAEFLNQVSHELRTPLAVIIGYIECITDGLYGQIDIKHNEILHVVAKQSTHLKNMIDQILIYSRLEAGKQPLRIEELQVTKVVNDLRDTFEFLCRQKGIELRWELPREAITMRSDATRVKEVVSNLLQNAVKYTDRGSISVRIGNANIADSVMIEVQDTGMGISEQHLTSIFEPFMQVHKTSSENSRGGIGLGLSIVKKHLDQINGTISVESELGKGSLFRIVLPRNPDKQKSRSRWLLPLTKRLSGPPVTLRARPQASTENGRQKPAKTRQALG